MDLGEAIRAIKAAGERRLNDMRWEAEQIYKQAVLIDISVNRELGGKAKLPEIEDVFPGLVDEEKLKADRELKKAQAWGEKFKAFADAWNERIEQQNG